MDNASLWQRLVDEGALPPQLRPSPAIYASWLRCSHLMQPAVLQVLKTGVVMRMNSSRVIPVNVQVIATSASATFPCW